MNERSYPWWLQLIRLALWTFAVWLSGYNWAAQNKHKELVDCITQRIADQQRLLADLQQVNHTLDGMACPKPEESSK